MFQVKYKKCGKKGCQKCPHGPYVYITTRVLGKVTTRYIGALKDIPYYMFERIGNENLRQRKQMTKKYVELGKNPDMLDKMRNSLGKKRQDMKKEIKELFKLKMELEKR